jgi:hypothetical protein
MKFLWPEKYWTPSTISTVKWVSRRLKCLVESMIKLTDAPFIDRNTLFQIAEGFYLLKKSKHFSCLPSSYPHKEIIEELQEKMTLLAKANKNHEKIKFKMSPKRKAILIAVRYQIGDFVPRIHFSHLDFQESESFVKYGYE